MNEQAKERRTLFEIVESLSSALWRVDDADGEVDDDLEAELDASHEELAEKANAILWVCDQHEAMADKMKARAKALTAKAKSVSATRDRLRAYLLDALIATDTDRLRCRDYPIVAVCAVPDAVDVDEAEFLREHAGDVDLCDERTTFKPIKKEIKARLVAGQRIEGCRLLTGRKRLGVR